MEPTTGHQAGHPVEKAAFRVVLAAVALAALLMILGGPRPVTGNLLENASAEHVDEQGRPVGWALYRSRGEAEWGTSEDATDGERSAMLRVRHSVRPSRPVTVGLLPMRWDGTARTAAPRLDPGACYRLSFSAKGTVRDMQVGLMVWARPDLKPARRLVSPRADRVFSRWTRHTFIFEAPSFADRAAPVIMIDQVQDTLAPEACLLVDDLDFRQISRGWADRLLGLPFPSTPPEYISLPISPLIWVRIGAVALGLTILGAVLLPVGQLGVLGRLLTGWAGIFFGLGILTLLSHYLCVSGFVLLWLALAASVGLVGWRLRNGFRWQIAGTGNCFPEGAAVLVPGLLLAWLTYRCGAGWLFSYAADMSDYLGRARMILPRGEFIPIDMGSPYGDHTPCAITTIVQVWYAVLSHISGCDLAYVSLVLNTIIAFVLTGVLYFVLRSSGAGPLLSLLGLPGLYLLLPFLQSFRWPAYNRTVAFAVGLISLALLARGVREQESRRRFSLLSGLVAGTVAGLHVPRAGAVLYVFVVLLATLAAFTQGSGVTASQWLRQWLRTVMPPTTLALLVAGLLLLPKTDSIHNLLLYRLQIAHLPGAQAQAFHEYPTWWALALFVAGLGLLWRAGSADRELRFRGALPVALVLAWAGVAGFHYLYPRAHLRNYTEPVSLIRPLLLTVPPVLSLQTLAQHRLRNRAVGAFSTLMVIAVATPLYHQVRSFHRALAQKTKAVEQLNRRCYLRDHADILEFLNAREKDSWPRIGGDPSQTQTLTTIANVRPAAWRLRLPHKSQLFDFGDVPLIECCHLLNAIDEIEAAIWCRRLKVDYVLDDWGEVQWDQRPDRFWHSPESQRFCVVDAPSNRLFVPPPAPAGFAWDWYESRVFRLRVDLESLRADRSPLMLEARCGEEVVPLEDQRRWRKSFIYRYYGRDNHKSWGDLEKTPDGQLGRRVFGPWKLIGRTKNLRAANFRLSFEGLPGEKLRLKFLDDRACTLHVDLWTGKHWAVLHRHQFAASQQIIELVIPLPNIPLTEDARRFPRLRPQAASTTGCVPNTEGASGGQQ